MKGFNRNISINYIPILLLIILFQSTTILSIISKYQRYSNINNDHVNYLENINSHKYYDQEGNINLLDGESQKSTISFPTEDYDHQNGNLISFPENDKENLISFPENQTSEDSFDGFETIKNISHFAKNILNKFSIFPKARNLNSTMNDEEELDAGVRFVGILFQNFNKKIQPIYPGTIWCGAGNKAQNDQSIGIFPITDSCCRQHDKCPDSIPTNKEKHGLKNTGIFTRSHCSCDREFYICLKKANTFLSNKIGATYFNILRPKCFRKEHPIINCLTWLNNRCKSYIVDNTKNPTWQWFDNREY